MRKFMIITALLAVGLLGPLSGCAQNPEQRKAELRQLVDFNDRLHAGIVATTQAAPAIDAQIAALPPGKVKTEAVKLSADVQGHLQTAAQLSAGAGNILQAAQSGDPLAAGAAVSSTLSAVPGVGPYAMLAGLLVTTAFGVYKSVQSSRAQSAAAAAEAQAQAHLDAAQKAQTDLKNVVQSIDVAGVAFSDAQKETIKKVQGPDTSATVEQIKSGG